MLPSKTTLIPPTGQIKSAVSWTGSWQKVWTRERVPLVDQYDGLPVNT
jgi:hypothetical protein